MKLRIVAGALALVLSGTAAWSQVTPGSGSAGSFGSVAITPVATTNNPGLTVSQSTPTSGSVAGPVTLNGITVIDNGQTVTGSVIDQWGQITNQTDMFRFNLRVTGGSANHFGVNVPVDITGTNGGTVPLISSCQVNVGPITGDCWVNIAVGNIGPSGNLNQSMIGYEAEMLIQDTGVGKDLIGFSANSQGPTVPTRYHEAYSISTSNQGLPHFMTGVPWTNGLHINSGLYGAGFPIASTGNIILADTGTVANFISAHTLTVTGNVIDLPSVNITGAGSMTLGTGSAATSNFMQVKCSTCGIATFTVSSNGTSGVNSSFINDSSGNNIAVASAFEASNSSVHFGQTAGNWVQFAAAGSTNAGILIGTNTSVPVIIGTNNTARMTFGGASGVTMNTALAMGGNNITGGGSATFTTFVGALTGHASSDLALTGGTMSGAIAMGGSNITGGGSATFTTFVGALTGHASLDFPLTGGTVTGAALSSSPTAGLGYATGAGGAVTQLTSRTTGVTLNTVSGVITMFTATNPGAWEIFTVTNSSVAATDTVNLSIKSGSTNTYIANVVGVAAGSFKIATISIAGAVSDTEVIDFNIIKGVSN